MRLFIIFNLLVVSLQAQTASLNLVSSNKFNTYVDTRVTKPTNGLVANQIVGVKAGATNLEYKTLVAGTGVSITHSTTNITFEANPINTLTDGSVTAPALNFANAVTNGLYLIDTNSFGVTIRGTNQLIVGTTGVTAPTLAITEGQIVSGTYTPTLSGANVNISSALASVCFYTRVGAVVTVGGEIAVTPTLGAGTNSRLSISLPIASNINATSDAAGWAGNSTATICVGPINGDPVNNQALWYFDAGNNVPTTVWFTFSYRIL